MAYDNYGQLPENHGNNNVWGPMLLAYISALKSNINANFALIEEKADSNHNHSARNIAVEGFENLENFIEDLRNTLSVYASHSNRITALETANAEKATQIENLENQITEINQKLSFFCVNLDAVNIVADISNIAGGIKIICRTEENISIPRWGVGIKKDGVVVWHGELSVSTLVLSDDILGVEEGDRLEIKITALSQDHAKSETFSHVFHETTTKMKEKLNNIEQNYTLDNFVDHFINKDLAMTELANRVHVSTTLASKIADLKNAQQE
jgi:hypothetical protein